MPSPTLTSSGWTSPSSLRAPGPTAIKEALRNRLPTGAVVAPPPPPAALAPRFRPWVRRHLKKMISFGTVSVIATAVAYVWPSVEIKPLLVPNDNNAMDVQFEIKNTGHLPIFNVVFGCGIAPKKGAAVFALGNMTGDSRGKFGQMIGALAPGASFTRNCGVGAPDFSTKVSYPAFFHLTATYDWPHGRPYVYRLQFTSATEFGSRSDRDGHIVLVPDSR